MKAGLLSGIGKSFTDAAGVAQWYYGEKKEDDRYKEQKGLLAQEKEEQKVKDALEKTEKDKRYYDEIVGQTEDGRPVTRGMLAGKEYDGPLYDKLGRPTGGGEIYVDENNIRVDPATHKGQIFRVGSYGAKGSTGETDLIDEKRFNELAASTLGVEDFAIGKRIKGDPPDQQKLEYLSKIRGERLIVKEDDGGFLGASGYTILPESVAGKPAPKLGDVELTIGDDAPPLDTSKMKKPKADNPASKATAKKEAFMKSHRPGTSPIKGAVGWLRSNAQNQQLQIRPAKTQVEPMTSLVRG